MEVKRRVMSAGEETSTLWVEIVGEGDSGRRREREVSRARMASGEAE